MSAHPLLVAGVTAGHLEPERAAEWTAAAHQALRESRGRVLGAVIAPGPGRNHYLVRVELRDGRPLRLMANLGVGLVAAADDTDPQTLAAAFCEVPRPDVFSLYGFDVALPADLDRPVTDDQLSELTDAERRDVEYHRPPRIGDVIFNWFD